ncbi:ATP-dependent helicase [Paenibacillus nasutitermitis]|uniref:DNA 3'-5' helicase n=1 Tax=Paenibacillus nasutitermitis TaxID=1652958 RepID=A0A916YLN6_9BACL|nr:ATP-dependent helicase [Paenibacillus nasutitermitis]GGD49669.1 DNA helicase [Paenibacillus nasutitermitis]
MITKEDFFARKEEQTGVTLNDIQKQAVLQTGGALLLLASPGSGKTTTIIMKIGYLIQQKKVDPSRIKAVTFSRASALDMKERFKRLFPELKPIDFSTIHSLAFEIVREHFRQTRTAYQIIEGHFDNKEQAGENYDSQQLHKKLILRNVYQSITGNLITEDQMEELTTYISYIKNKMIPSDKWAQVPCEVKQAERILIAYEEFKRSGSGSGKLLLDFDDMLTTAGDVLKMNRELLGKYQQRYDVLLTDESQDTSLIQHAIIEELAREHGNLCVVADDDQSIYSWRGAEPSYLLHFRDVYPDAVILYMEQNYRSSADIVSVANGFIKRNKKRYDKNMFTANEAHEPVAIRHFTDYNHQSKYVVEHIHQLTELREVAVLYRNSSSSIMLMNECERSGVPFYMKDSDNRFFSHWIVKDMLNIMRMTYTDKRYDLLEQVYTKLNGYITKHQMSVLREIQNNESVFDNLLSYVDLQEYQRKPIQECKETLQQMKGMPPLEAIRVIRTKLGYDKAIDKMVDRLGFRKDYLIGNLNTLEEIASTLGSMEEFAGRLKHLEAVMKASSFNNHQNVVTLSTFHSAKGLEFETVYMIDLVAGVIPSAEDMKQQTEGNAEPMEEAVRLFYVGMTRAKRHLELLTYKYRDGVKMDESAFVGEVARLLNPAKLTVRTEEPESPMDPNALTQRSDLVIGRIIEHRVFGRGEIMKLTEERVHIEFQTGAKALSLQTCLDKGILTPVE